MIALVLLVVILVVGLIEITALVFYQQFFTGGEIFALITANQYEANDIGQYCTRNVSVYWISYTIICITLGWLIGKQALYSNNAKRICIYIILEVLFLLPFTILPLKSNIVLETFCVIKQICAINQHKHDNADFVYYAKREHPSTEKEIYVLSLGESVRYKNLSLNSEYKRETTPLLHKQANLVLYSDYYANATLTQHALPMLLTDAEADCFNRHFSRKSIAAAFAEAGFRTALVSHRAQLMNNGYHDYLTQDFDTLLFVPHDSLIAPVVAQLADENNKLFVLSHYLGNHMFYNNRTDDCLKWRPDYNADPKATGDSLFLNAYDNSLLYTDKLLSEFISILDSTDAVCSWLFVSDHGEYISPKVSGHGHTYHPQKEEYHVPLMVWYSDEYKEAYPQKVANMISHKDEPTSADNVFWSVLDMAGIRLDRYAEKQRPLTLKEKGLNMSIFGDTLQPQKRELLLPDGSGIKYL